MSPPANLSAATLYGHTLLLSQNSINNMGRGPAEMFGRRSGEYTMSAVQHLHLRRGGLHHDQHGRDAVLQADPGPVPILEVAQRGGDAAVAARQSRQPCAVRARRSEDELLPARPQADPRLLSPGRRGGRITRGAARATGRGTRTLGTSVGWSDIYPASYNENYIDVTGLTGALPTCTSPTRPTSSTNQMTTTTPIRWPSGCRGRGRARGARPRGHCRSALRTGAGTDDPRRHAFARTASTAGHVCRMLGAGGCRGRLKIACSSITVIPSCASARVPRRERRPV